MNKLVALGNMVVWRTSCGVSKLVHDYLRDFNGCIFRSEDDFKAFVKQCEDELKVFNEMNKERKGRYSIKINGAGLFLKYGSPLLGTTEVSFDIIRVGKEFNHDAKVATVITGAFFKKGGQS